MSRAKQEVVDAGLVRGLGEPVPGEMCVEAAVCYELGLVDSDGPPYVADRVRALKIQLANINRWDSRELHRLAIAQLGAAGYERKLSRAKQVKLHLRCAVSDGEWLWHLRGIWRALRV